MTDGERHVHEPEDGGAAVIVIAPPTVPMTLKTDYSWSEIISYTWRMEEHINFLELRAAILACRWILSHPSSARKRVMLVIDSAVDRRRLLYLLSIVICRLSYWRAV